MIHKFHLNDFFIVLDVNSGAVHVCDNLIFNMLDFIKPPILKDCPKEVISALNDNFSNEDIISAYNDLYELYEQGKLFSSFDYKPFAEKIYNATLKSMCLNIAHDCNLRCEYCFAAKGDFGTGRRLMPFEVSKAAIDFLIEHSKGRHNLEVDFFGGEPLMNFEIVKKTVDYARSIEKKYNKNFRFTITTNGILLNDDKIDYINREMSNVVLSIDGRPEINDKLRVRANKLGCYEEIIKKYIKLLDKRLYKNYYVRGTFTKYNLDFSKDVIHLFEKGFDQISVEPVVSDENLNFSIKEEDLPRVFDEYETLAKEIIQMKKNNHKINFFHFMVDLNDGPCAIKRLRGCGCGNEYIAVTPEGDIYPCHQFVGNSKFIMGNILDGSYNAKMKSQFAGANIFTKNKCNDCWAKFFCSGGCNANNFTYEGNILNPHKLSCEIEKKRLECSIMINAALSDL